MKLIVEKTISWNQRLGHSGENGLRVLKNKSLVDGLDDCNIKFYFCEHYVYGKKNCVSFYSNSCKSFGVLDYIDANVFCPIYVPSI